MKTERLELPCTSIQVLVNDSPIEFEYQNSSYNKYYCDNDEEVTVLGALDIILNPAMYHTNDIIYIRASAGKLQNDGGDEGTVNCVSELEKYTYGMGGPDTEFIEWNYGKHMLDYELIEISDKGLKYRIVECSASEKYRNGELIITVVWEDNNNDYAYDIVSFLTC